MTWVALHEVTHAVQFAGVPWLQGHLAGLVRELLPRAPRCGSTPQRRLRLPSREEAQRGSAALRRGDLIGLVDHAAERETLDRVQAVMAVIEGHAEHVMDAVAPDLLPSLPRLRARDRPPAQVAVRPVAAGRAAARPGDEAAPVRARARSSATRSCEAGGPRR